MEIFRLDCLNLEINPVNLIYLDPPYGSKSEDTYFGVGNSKKEYLEYIEKRLEHLSNLLLPNGNIILHADYKNIHYLKIIMDNIFGEANFRNEIIWGFSNPSNAKRWLPRKHQTLLWYGLSNYTFNPIYTQYNNLKVGGSTSWAGTSVDTSSYLNRGKKLESWWTDIPAICRNEPEKTGYPTQKPKALMSRILQIWSNPKDRVLDPFCGSAAFLKEAEILDRVAIGADIAHTE